MNTPTDAAASSAPQGSYGDALRVLRYLGTPQTYLRAVDEEFLQEGDVLRRRVTLHLDAEQVFPVASAGAQVFTMVALKPTKTTLVTLECDREQGPLETTRLSHSQHKRLEQFLIVARCTSIWSTARIPPHRREEAGRACLEILRQLRTIPILSSEEAQRVYRNVFHKKRGMLPRLLMGPAGATYARPDNQIVIDWINYRRLKRLCRELVSRYYLAYRVRSKNITDRTISFQYMYVHPFQSRALTPLGRLRNRQGAVAARFRVHIPLARMTSHYTVRMAAPTGYYFSSKTILIAKSKQKRSEASDASRDFDIAGDPGTKNYHEGVSIERNVRSFAHLFLPDGYRLNRRLYAGLHLREIPPGSTGRAFNVVCLTIGACALLFAWIYVYKSTSSVAPLLAGLLGLGSYAVEVTTPSIPLLGAPVLPRLVLRLQAIVGMLFAMWLLSRSSGPPNPGTGWDWAPLRYVWNKWQAFGGIFLLLMLAVMAVLLGVRLHRLRRLWAFTETI